MKFYDEQHKQFYEQKLKELQQYGKTDCYYRAITYCLSISETTRTHFNEIFSIKNGEINIDTLQAPYQTSTSLKVTRAAFSLWNSCCYDSKEDREKDKVSEYFGISDIFCSTYAPYIYEAVKIRYPEYTEESDKNEKGKIT